MNSFLVQPYLVGKLQEPRAHSGTSSEVKEKVLESRTNHTSLFLPLRSSVRGGGGRLCWVQFQGIKCCQYLTDDWVQHRVKILLMYERKYMVIGRRKTYL